MGQIELRSLFVVIHFEGFEELVAASLGCQSVRGAFLEGGGGRCEGVGGSTADVCRGGTLGQGVESPGRTEVGGGSLGFQCLFLVVFLFPAVNAIEDVAVLGLEPGDRGTGSFSGGGRCRFAATGRDWSARGSYGRSFVLVLCGITLVRRGCGVKRRSVYER